MMKARSNTMKLRWRNWGTDEEKICQTCNCEVETLEHFLIDYHPLQEVRNQVVDLQWPKNENDKEENISKMLLLKIE